MTSQATTYSADIRPEQERDDTDRGFVDGQMLGIEQMYHSDTGESVSPARERLAADDGRTAWEAQVSEPEPRVSRRAEAAIEDPMAAFERQSAECLLGDGMAVTQLRRDHFRLVS